VNPPGKTTLDRIQLTALLEAERIEISQDARVMLGMQKEPMPGQVTLRDDFMGVVRLIDLIMSDLTLHDRLKERMAAQASVIAARRAAGAEDIAVEAEDAE
jgi:hypothetical protein